MAITAGELIGCEEHLNLGSLVIRLGKRNWLKLNLIPILAAQFKLSNSEVKRIIKNGGLLIMRESNEKN